MYHVGTFINCDVRYFSFAALGGNFDVVLLDPPWRVRGRHGTDERTMFTNSTFYACYSFTIIVVVLIACYVDDWTLDYNTLTNEEIFDLDIGSLSTTGLIFLWV
jgi:mRNA (2'-O-methyladenosine-N6-)-methyltransferase